MTTDYVNEMTLFYNKDFVIADSYTVIEPALSLFKQDQSITHAELNDYMKEYKDFKLPASVLVFIVFVMPFFVASPAPSNELF